MVWWAALLLPSNKPRGRAAVARRAHNPKVIGSNPILATNKKLSLLVRLLFFTFIQHFLQSIHEVRFRKHIR